MAVFSPGEAVLDAKAIFFFFYAFTGTRGEKQAGFANETQDGKLRVWRLKEKKIISKIVMQEAAVTVLVLTSIMLFPVLKCYSVYKCLSKSSTIRCTQTVLRSL